MPRPFDQFRALVFDDPELQQALDAVTYDAEFASLASQLAGERGLEIDAGEVLAELNRARQSWLLRTLP